MKNFWAILAVPVLATQLIATSAQAQTHERFFELARHATSDREAIRAFARNMPATEFGELQDLLNPFDYAQNLDDVRNQRIAFRIIVAESAPIRKWLAGVVRDPGKFVPHKANEALATALMAFVRYGDDQGSEPIDPDVFEALVAQRAYASAVEVPGIPGLGDQVRTLLFRQAEIYAGLPPTEFIGPFAEALSPAQVIDWINLPQWKDPAERAPVEAWEANFRARLIGPLTAADTSARLQTEDQLVPALVAALVSAYATDSLDEEVMQAVGRTVERSVALWSEKFDRWGAPDFDNDIAFKAEIQLWSAIDELHRNGGALIAPAQSADYLALISTLGGWSRDQLEAGGATPPAPAQPAWARDWKGAAETLGIIAVPFAKAPLAFVRLANRTRDLGESSTPGSDTYSERWMDHERLLALAHGIDQQTGVQGFPVQYGLLDGQPADLVPTAISADEWTLPLDIVQANRKWHGSHLAALRIVLAGYYVWRADIAYREIGPRRLGENLCAEPPANQGNVCPAVDATRHLYEVADALLSDPSLETAPRLGLFGRALRLERQRLIAEVKGRLLQIASGADYAGESFSWPNIYAETLITNTAADLNALKTLQTWQQASFDQQRLSARYKIAEQNHGSAEWRLEAARSNLDAERSITEAAEAERRAQEAQITIAKLGIEESDYVKKAADAAVLVATDEVQGKQELKNAEDFALDLINKQNTTLRKNIEPLPEKIQGLQQAVDSADQELGKFVDRAQQQNRNNFPPKDEPGFFDQLGGIVRKVISLVSIYYTGGPIGHR